MSARHVLAANLAAKRAALFTPRAWEPGEDVDHDQLVREYIEALEAALIDLGIDPVNGAPEHADALEPGQRNPYDRANGEFLAPCLCGFVGRGQDPGEAENDRDDHIDWVNIDHKAEREALVKAGYGRNFVHYLPAERLRDYLDLLDGPAN